MSTKIQFTVEMTCENCEKEVRSALEGIPGIEKLEISRENNDVIIEGTAPFTQLINSLRNTKKVRIENLHHFRHENK